MAGVRVLYVEQVVRDLDRLSAASDDLAAFSSIGDDVQAEAVARVRVYTGATRATITSHTGPNTAVISAGAEDTAPAGVLNYRNPGDEFLTSPANENIAEKARIIDANLDALIRRYRLYRFTH